MPKRRAGCHFPATSSGRGGPGTRLRTWLPGLPGLAILSRHSWGSGVAPGPLLAGWSSLPCTSQKKRADDPQLLKGQAVAGTQAGLPLPHRSTDPGGAWLAPRPPRGPSAVTFLSLVSLLALHAAHVHLIHGARLAGETHVAFVPLEARVTPGPRGAREAVVPCRGKISPSETWPRSRRRLARLLLKEAEELEARVAVLGEGLSRPGEPAPAHEQRGRFLKIQCSLMTLLHM